MNIFKTLRYIGTILVGLLCVVVVGGLLFVLVAGAVDLVNTEGWGALFSVAGWVLVGVATFAVIVGLSCWIGDNWEDWEKNAREKNRYIVEYQPEFWDRYFHVYWVKDREAAEKVYEETVNDQYESYKVRLRKGKETLKEEDGKRDL